MNTSEFFGKLKSSYFWGNILAMAIVVAALLWGTKFAIDIYTHHGESVAIPDIRHKSFADAEHILADAGLDIVVSDTGYVKSLPPNCILEQSPEAGMRVKTGHIIYVTVNASHSPQISLPDIIENSSLREAMAKLTAMGFKLTQPQFVPGEKDWVVGVVAGTRQLQTGDKVSVDTPITIQVGNGQLSADDSINFIDNAATEDDFIDEGGDVDEFHEVTEEEGKSEE